MIPEKHCTTTRLVFATGTMKAGSDSKPNSGKSSKTSTSKPNSQPSVTRPPPSSAPLSAPPQASSLDGVVTGGLGVMSPPSSRVSSVSQVSDDRCDVIYLITSACIKRPSIYIYSVTNKINVRITSDCIMLSRWNNFMRFKINAHFYCLITVKIISGKYSTLRNL